MICSAALAASLVLFLPGDDLTASLDDVLVRLAGAQGARTWELAGELRDTAWRDSEVAVPHLIERAASATPEVQVVIAQTLLEMEAVDDAAALLLPLLDGPLAGETLGVLADRAFRSVPSVGERLAAELGDAGQPMGVRIDLARTLSRVSRDANKAAARDFLFAALESDDPETRALSALALAEIGQTQEARSVLRTLAADPGPRGQLARAYIDLEDAEEDLSRRLTRQSEQPPGGRATVDPEQPSGTGSLDVLEELITRIQDMHLMGEELRGPEGRERLITEAAKGMLNALDPHSTYFSGKEFERWILELRRNYAGIGAYVDTINGRFTITRPIYSGPAYRAGLKTGDKILEVDGWETLSHTNDDIIQRLKGEPGTEVTVTVVRDGWEEERPFTIQREVIHIPSVSHDLLPGGLGYIEVLGFAEGTTKEMQDALKDLRRQGARGLILDLRNNNGGYLTEAVHMASTFLPAGQLVVYTEGREVAREDYVAQPTREHFDGPLVVLINRFSASASEIVSGALKVTERAELVGERTFGKGSVQQALALETRPGDQLTDANYNNAYDPGETYVDQDSNGQFTYGAEIKITNARYYLPDGTSIHTERDFEGRVTQAGGVTPDHEVEFTDLEPWQNNELAELWDRVMSQVAEGATAESPFQRWARERFVEHRELFYRLADGDGRDTSLYPGFSEFRDSLGTHLPDDTIRLLLRSEVRDLVAEDRGQAFPGSGIYGDWQEDEQIQQAIRVLAGELALDLDTIEDYRLIAQMPAAEDEPGEPK